MKTDKNKSVKNLENQKVNTDNVKGGRKKNSHPLLEEHQRPMDGKFGDSRTHAGGRIKSKLANPNVDPFKSSSIESE